MCECVCVCVCVWGGGPHPGSERQQLQQHLHGEEAGEDHVEDVHDVAEGFGLLVVLRQRRAERRPRRPRPSAAFGGLLLAYLDGQGDRVEQDEHEHDVLKASGVDDGPELVLDWVLWDVQFQRLSLQSVLHTLALHTHTHVNRKCEGEARGSLFQAFTWFLSSSQFLYSCSPCSRNVMMTKPTKMFIMKKAMMMM